MQNLNVLLDISSIIWDEVDYKTKEHEYYDLVDGITYFFEKLENENPKVLISGNLRDELMANFPFGKPPHKGGDFEGQTLKFLSKVETCEYSSPLISDIISIPNLVKNHYNDNVKDEIHLLMSKIHIDTERENVYFTFEYLWDGEGKLKTEAQLNQKEYETIICDRGSELDDFFAKFRLVFEHKPKHDCSINKNRAAWNDSDDKGNFESQLSCYCDNDEKIVQGILDKRHKKCFGNNSYYGYDSVNNVYVVFRITLNNIYHAYDMYDIERVPQEVKNKFRIWKY